MIELNLNYWQQVVAVYFIVINIVTFFIFAIDKWKATSKSHRFSEKMLWFLTLIGGSIGGLIAMKMFRHKTKKLSFQTVLAIIILFQIGLVIWLLDIY